MHNNNFFHISVKMYLGSRGRVVATLNRRLFSSILFSQYLLWTYNFYYGPLKTRGQTKCLGRVGISNLASHPAMNDCDRECIKASHCNRNGMTLYRNGMTLYRKCQSQNVKVKTKYNSSKSPWGKLSYQFHMAKLFKFNSATCCNTTTPMVRRQQNSLGGVYKGWFTKYEMKAAKPQ